MTAYLIDSSITPLHFMVSDALIVTDRARRVLVAERRIPPELLAALILRAVSEIGPVPECQREMYVTQFCNNLKGSETT